MSEHLSEHPNSLSEQGNRMNPEIKARWVAALRSGEFKQCRLMLHDDGKYCCLGVLQAITSIRRDGDYPELLYFPEAQAIGVSTDTQDALSSMNDGNASHGILGRSFQEIADWIEENL